MRMMLLVAACWLVATTPGAAWQALSEAEMRETTGALECQAAPPVETKWVRKCVDTKSGCCQPLGDCVTVQRRCVGWRKVSYHVCRRVEVPADSPDQGLSGAQCAVQVDCCQRVNFGWPGDAMTCRTSDCAWGDDSYVANRQKTRGCGP